jgi:hypothetical protein
LLAPDDCAGPKNWPVEGSACKFRILFFPQGDSRVVVLKTHYCHLLVLVGYCMRFSVGGENCLRSLFSWPLNKADLFSSELNAWEEEDEKC